MVRRNSGAGLLALLALRICFESIFFQAPHPVDHRYFPDLLDDVEVVQVDGDAQIVDGISVLLTPGHTVGGQSVVVDTKGGRAVITGFC